MSDRGKAVFLSYASQDAEAAKRICEALRAAGVEVWFDQNELVGGDAWDQKIRRQIKDCALLIPIISTATQARTEGYFRLEWRLADQRTHLMAKGRPFLLPVVIDDTRDADAHVPDSFTEVQWTRLLAGEGAAAFAVRVQKLLGGASPVAAVPLSDRVESADSNLMRPDEAPGSRSPATAKGQRSIWVWLGPAMVIALIVVGLIRQRARREETGKAAASLTAPPATLTEAQGPTAQTRRSRDSGDESIDSTVRDKSVAVLAFANLSADTANEYFSDGISEELLNVLAKIPDLKVAARTSAFYFKGKEVPIPEIARQLGVAYVVEGSVRKNGDKVRISAQLIKAADGFHVWSDTFTRDIKDVFAVQDEIAGLIARNISPMLNTAPVAKSREIAPDAYQEYLLGRSAMAKAVMADLRESLVHFERAVAIEPKFTAAWVQLANAHTRLGRWGGAPAIASWRAARAAIDRAVALEPDSPEVLVALGWILRTGEWKWREAERAFRRALELRPNQPDVLAGAAVLLYNIGQTEEAMRLGQRAAQLDPLNASTQIDLSIMFYLHGDLAEAETTARRALQLAPDGASYHAILAWSLIDQKRFAEAEAEIALDPDPVEQPTAYGRLALARGDEATARKMIAQLEELAQTNPDAADLQQSIAWICAGIGEKENDRSFAALERAKASRDPSMAWLLSSRYLLPLQSDPRWEKLKRSMGLTEDQLR